MISAPQRRRWSQGLALFSFGLFLSLTTVLLATPTMKVIRNHLGARAFALFVTLASLVMMMAVEAPELAVMFWGVVVSSTLVWGLEKSSKLTVGLRWLTTLLACMLGAAVSMSVYAFWAKKGLVAGPDLFSGVLQGLQKNVDFGSEIPNDKWVGFLEDLKEQSFSILVIFNLASLFVAEVFEVPATAFFGFGGRLRTWSAKAIQWRVPNAFIWVAMTSALVMVMASLQPGFVKIGPETQKVAANALNISVMLYFFQGLAVIEVLLVAFRTGLFLKGVIYLIAIFQLFFVTAGIGFTDFWADYRRRFRIVKERKT